MRWGERVETTVRNLGIVNHNGFWRRYWDDPLVYDLVTVLTHLDIANSRLQVEIKRLKGEELSPGEIEALNGWGWTDG